MEDKVVLQIKAPRSSEETPENMVQMLSSFTGLMNKVFLFRKKGIPLSLEMAYVNQQIHFYMVIPKAYQPFIESQILSQYPRTLITTIPDYIPEVFAITPEDIQAGAQIRFGRLMQKAPYYLPIKTFRDTKDVNPLSSLLGMLAKLPPNDSVLIQFLLVPTSSKWRSSAMSAVQPSKSADGTSVPNPHASIVPTKTAEHGFRVGIRILVKSATPSLYSQLATSFSVFNNANGNSFGTQRTYPWQQDKLYQSIIKRTGEYVPKYQILNLSEIATMFHFPNKSVANIPNIAWTKTILSDPPENLPVASILSDEEKKDVNFFAKTEYRNTLAVFGIKKKDRRRHQYIIGKTGSGKSTLIANMVINDMRNGEGCAVIDPHGDLTEVIMDYVPSHRINDVIYLNPGDQGGTFSINPLEAGGQHKDLVSSGIVAIFHKIYGDSWGPRLEYILRNVILSLMDVPDSTLLMVPRILTDAKFRARVVERIEDPIVKAFWTDEFEKMPDRNKADAIGPILNKVGQFLSSNTIRGIVGQPKSTVNLREAMDSKKIILFNLSQGKLGEDNAALLGAMTITKMQLAAMSRVDIAEEDRQDFYLYVDEFQNFATTSFIKILSEARKYRLDLILANQYTAQIPEELMAAIFGNVGTLMTFIVGAQDAEYLAKEYGERFTQEDLLALGNYQALLKLYIDGVTTSPFMTYTLPLPRSANNNREKVIKVSNERYNAPVNDTPTFGDENTPDISRVDQPKKPEAYSNNQNYQRKEPYKKNDQNYVKKPYNDRPQNQEHAKNENRKYDSKPQGQNATNMQNPRPPRKENFPNTNKFPSSKPTQNPRNNFHDRKPETAQNAPTAPVDNKNQNTVSNIPPKEPPKPNSTTLAPSGEFILKQENTK
jgi:hypothetical protein